MHIDHLPLEHTLRIVVTLYPGTGADAEFSSGLEFVADQLLEGDYDGECDGGSLWVS